MALGDPFSGALWSDKWMPFYTPGRQFASDRGAAMFQMPAPPGSIGLADLNLDAQTGLPTPTAGGTSGVGDEAAPSTLPSDISNVINTAARGTRSLSGGDSSTPSGEGIGLGDVSNALSGLGGAANLAGGIVANRPAQAVGGGLQLAGAGARLGGLSDIGTAAGGVGGLLGLEEGIRGLATGTATPAQAVLPIASGALSTAGAANALFPNLGSNIGRFISGGDPTGGATTGLGTGALSTSAPDILSGSPSPDFSGTDTTGIGEGAGVGGDIAGGIGGLGGLYNISTAIQDLLSGQGNSGAAGTNLGSGLLNVYTTVANLFPDLSLPTINSLISSAVSSLTGAGSGAAGAATAAGATGLGEIAGPSIGAAVGAGAEGAGSGGAAALGAELGGLGAGLGAGAVVAAPFVFSAVARALGAGGLDIADFWGGGAEGGDFAGVSKARGQLRTKLGDEAATNFQNAQQAGQTFADAQKQGITDPTQLKTLGDQLMGTATSYFTPLEAPENNRAMPGLGGNAGLGQSSTPQGLTAEGRAPFTDALTNAMQVDQYLRATGNPGLNIPTNLANALGLGTPLNQGNASAQGADFVPQYDPALGPPPTDPAELQNYYRQALINKYGAPQQPYAALTPEQLAVANRAQYTYAPPPQAAPMGLADIYQGSTSAP